jgi:hypothetical protein
MRRANRERTRPLDDGELRFLAHPAAPSTAGASPLHPSEPSKDAATKTSGKTRRMQGCKDARSMGEAASSGRQLSPLKSPSNRLPNRSPNFIGGHLHLYSVLFLIAAELDGLHWYPPVSWHRHSSCIKSDPVSEWDLLIDTPAAIADEASDHGVAHAPSAGMHTQRGRASSAAIPHTWRGHAPSSSAHCPRRQIDKPPRSRYKGKSALSSAASEAAQDNTS